MTENLQIWLGNGWRVRVLFSGGGLSTSILVSLDSGTSLLLDCGDGCLRDLVSQAMDLHGLDAVLVTHGHFDHVGGLYSLLGYMRMIGRNTPFIILAPHKAREDKLIIDAFATLYPDSLPFDIPRREVKGGEEIKLGDIKVTAFDTIHCGSTQKGGIGDPLPAVGYSLQYHGERVVYTGDCGLHSNLEPYISGADLLIIEATLNESGGEMESKVHLSLESARRFAASAKKAFIIHRPGGLSSAGVG